MFGDADGVWKWKIKKIYIYTPIPLEASSKLAADEFQKNIAHTILI